MVNVVGWAVPGSDDAGKGSAAGKFLCRRRALPAELLDSDGQAPLQCIHFDLSVAKHIQVLVRYRHLSDSICFLVRRTIRVMAAW